MSKSIMLKVPGLGHIEVSSEQARAIKTHPKKKVTAMNRHTRDIMKLLGVSSQFALIVQYRMEINGLDFSECTAKQFNAAAKQAHAEESVV